MKRWFLAVFMILMFIQTSLATDAFQKSERAYNHYPDGLYIIESGEAKYYPIKYINDMSKSDKTDLITKILSAENNECWFVLANYHGFYGDFTGGIANWPEDDQAMSQSPEIFYDVENQYHYNVWTGEIVNAMLLKNLGPEGPLYEEANVYNIIDNSALLGIWSVSIQITRLPEPCLSGTGWGIVTNGEEFPFTENPFDPQIHETTVPETQVSDIEEIRNSVFKIIQ